jgi:hypothetical protein
MDSAAPHLPAASGGRSLDDLYGLVEALGKQITDGLTEVKGKLGGVETRLAGVETRLAGTETRLAGVETRLAGTETRLAGVETRLAGMDSRENGRYDNDRVRATNAARGPHDGLEKIKFTRLGNDLPERIEQPVKWGQLSVAGNEAIPGTREATEWNKRKSAAFLQAYMEEAYASDASEGEVETTRSRFRRVRVAEIYGIPSSRLGALGTALCGT